MHQAEILPRPWDPFLSLPLLTTKPRCRLPVPTWPWCLLADQEHSIHATWAQESRCLHGVPGLSYLRAGVRQCRVVTGVGSSQRWAWARGCCPGSDRGWLGDLWGDEEPLEPPLTYLHT